MSTQTGYGMFVTSKDYFSLSIRLDTLGGDAAWPRRNEYDSIQNMIFEIPALELWATQPTR